MSREAPVVDALIGICVHDPDTFVEPPSVVRNWAAQALAGQIEGAVLSPEAKTAFLMTQGALSFEESEKAAAADLTDQMHEVMAGSGLDPAAYDLRSFTEELRPNLKILCMAAVRKEVPQVAPDEAKSVEATVSPVQVRKQRITPLIEAVQKQDAEAVRSRIQAGDDIEATDSYGQTALHWATKDKSVEIVQLLLEAGADFNAKDEDGYTPWQNAEQNANPAMAEALAQLEGRLATESEKKHEVLGTAMVAKETPVATSGRVKTHPNTGERNSAISAMTIKERFTLEGDIYIIWDCAISPDSSLIISGSADGTLKVWDAATGKHLATLTGHTNMLKPRNDVTTCAISPDSSFFVWGSENNTFVIWDVATGKERRAIPRSPFEFVMDHFDAVSDCAISPDSSFIVSASEDRALKVWDAATGQERATLAGHTAAVNHCAISPDSSYIVSASSDSTLKVWDAATGWVRATLTGHTGNVADCAISPDSSFIVSASWDNTLKVWDAATGQERATLAGHTKGVRYCAISPDSSFIVSASEDSTLKVWDAAMGEERVTLTGHTDGVHGCAISPDSSFIVSASEDNTLKVWDAAMGEERVTLTGHTNGVHGCAISPDSSFILSWSSDGTLKIWDVASVIRENREAKPVHLVEAVDQTPAEEGPEVTASDVTSMREQGDVESLVQVLQGDSDPLLRWLAAKALGDLGGPRARDALQNCLINDEPLVAAAASTALGQLEATLTTGTQIQEKRAEQIAKSQVAPRARAVAPASRPAVKEPPKKRRLPVWAIVLLVLGAATLVCVGLAMVATEPRVVETPATEAVALQPAEEEPTLPTPELTGVAPEPTVQRAEEEAKQVFEISPEPTESISEPTPTPATAAASPDAATATIPTAAATSAAESTAVLGEWIPVDFMIPNPSLWRDTAEGIYTAVGSEDAFAWSRKAYDGNLMVGLDLKSSDNRASGCVVVYGDGQGFSQGNLIFCVDWDGYGLEKHTIYHEGENYLTWVHDDSVDLKNNVYSVTIEIIDDVASMYVNGERVFSAFFDTEEINRGGRVGLLKKWFDPEITFSNVQIKALGDEDG